MVLKGLTSRAFRSSEEFSFESHKQPQRKPSKKRGFPRDNGVAGNSFFFVRRAPDFCIQSSIQCKIRLHIFSGGGNRSRSCCVDLECSSLRFIIIIFLLSFPVLLPRGPGRVPGEGHCHLEPRPHRRHHEGDFLLSTLPYPVLYVCPR